MLAQASIMTQGSLLRSSRARVTSCLSMRQLDCADWVLHFTMLRNAFDCPGYKAIPEPAPEYAAFCSMPAAGIYPTKPEPA